MVRMWKTKDGRTIPITEMTDTHLLNSIKYVRRRVEDAIARQFDIDPNLVPTEVYARLDKARESAVWGDASHQALMAEAVRRKILLPDGTPAPWERSPFSPPDSADLKVDSQGNFNVSKRDLAEMNMVAASLSKAPNSNQYDSFVKYLADQFVMKQITYQQMQQKIREAAMGSKTIEKDVGTLVAQELQAQLKQRLSSEKLNKTFKQLADVQIKDYRSFLEDIERRSKKLNESRESGLGVVPTKKDKKKSAEERLEWKPGRRKIAMD